MVDETVSRRYATAVFSLAKAADAVERVADGLHRADDAIRSDPDVRRMFVSPVVNRLEKAKALEQALSASVDTLVLHTVLLLVRKRRERLLSPIVGEYDKLALAERGLEPLEITSSHRLDRGELDAIVARLARSYGKTFDVREKVDPALLGGIRITMGDRRIDGSVAGRLDQLAREMFSNS